VILEFNPGGGTFGYGLTDATQRKKCKEKILDGDGGFFEQLFFAVDHGIDVGGGQLEAVTVGDGVRGAGFDAVAAKDAARIIDVVDAGVAFTGGDSLDVSIFGGFDVDATGGASRGAEEAADTFFQPIFVAVKDVDAAVAGLEMDGFFGIIFGDGLAKHIAERHAKALYERDNSFAGFFDD